MTPLHFKQEAEFEKRKKYSVCLRGARRYDTSDEFHLSLYTPNQEEPKLAMITSQKQFVFHDVQDKHCEDNYDIDARTREGLLIAMTNVYNDFEMSEIVTVLQFRIV